MSSFTITVTENKPLSDLITQQELAVERYRQTVDTINLPAVIAAINPKPPRVRRAAAKVKAS
jgi:hypothetical protein